MAFVVKQAYWCISQISGEHLLDHWFSGSLSRAEHEKGFITLGPVRLQTSLTIQSQKKARRSSDWLLLLLEKNELTCDHL